MGERVGLADNVGMVEGGGIINGAVYRLQKLAWVGGEALADNAVRNDDDKKWLLHGVGKLMVGEWLECFGP